MAAIADANVMQNKAGGTSVAICIALPGKMAEYDTRLPKEAVLASLCCSRRIRPRAVAAIINKVYTTLIYSLKF